MNATLNIIQLYSSVLVLIGSFYLCRAVLITHPKLIALHSRTYIGGNKYILEGLTRQQTDSIIGFTLLIGTMLGVASLLLNINLPTVHALQLSGFASLNECFVHRSERKSDLSIIDITAQIYSHSQNTLRTIWETGELKILIRLKQYNQQIFLTTIGNGSQPQSRMN